MGLTQVVWIAQDYDQGKDIEDLRLLKAIFELTDNKTEHLPDNLPFVSGMLVLLTENIATELGHSNGARGIFHQLAYGESSIGTSILRRIHFVAFTSSQNFFVLFVAINSRLWETKPVPSLDRGGGLRQSLATRSL